MSKKITYTFTPITHCVMCGSSDFKVLGKRLNQSQGKNPKQKIGIAITVQLCKGCGLIFSNPQPTPQKISDHYSVPPESYWKEEYFIVKENYFRSAIKWYDRLKGIEKGKKYLDIGAGIGKQMVALERAGFDVYGIEPSETFRDMAISKMGIAENKLQLTSIEEAKFENNFFDFISFGAVLEHIYNPSEALHKAMQWLKPGGLIHAEVPHSRWLISKLLNRYYRLRGTDYVSNLSPMHSPFHMHEFTLNSFKKNSAINNYKVVDSVIYPCETFLPSVFNSLLKKYMKQTGTGMQLVVWLEKSSI